MSNLPFVPPAGQQPVLINSAKAHEQFARLLDALLVLDAEGACRVGDLANRVGLAPERLRELLSAYMVAGADALGPDAPFNVMWGNAQGVLGGDEADDDLHSSADYVYLASDRPKGEWLVGDVGRRPVLVKDVARALLAASVALEDKDLPDQRRAELTSLVGTLSTAMKASVDTPAESTATVLQKAVRACTTVRFRYVHAWTGESVRVEVEPYDVWRRRDRLVLDAGDGTGAWSAYDISGISEIEVLATTFEPPTLPPRTQRVPQIPVVLAVPAGSKAEDWLLGGWNGRVIGPLGDGRIEIAIGLDGDAADPGVLQRLGVLLLQLGAGCEVRQPGMLVDAAKGVGRRLLALHGAG